MYKEPSNAEAFPNVRDYLDRYSEMIIYLNKCGMDETALRKMPENLRSIFDDPELEFAKVLNHDADAWAVKIAKLILVMHNEYEIKVKVE